jgi:SM-20-related protein
MVSFNQVIIDDFLPTSVHDHLLKYCNSEAENFVPTGVRRNNDYLLDVMTRRSLYHKGGLGPHKAVFEQAIVQKKSEIVAGLGIEHFESYRLEVELAAHGDGSFFKPHIDTFAGANSQSRSRDRIVTLVYYFHAQPRRFDGGELVIYPLGEGEPAMIEPRDNRLVAFPSFAPHEVRVVSCPDGDFQGSRFAVNCWITRPKVAQGTPPREHTSGGQDP